MPCNDPVRLPCFVCSCGVRRVVGLVCRCVYVISVIFRCNVCLSEVWRDEFVECRKKSHSDTMFWCRWRAIINNTWTHKLSSNGVSLFTSKGAKPTEPASLLWVRFVSVFYGAIYIITYESSVPSTCQFERSNRLRWWQWFVLVLAMRINLIYVLSLTTRCSRLNRVKMTVCQRTT